MCAHPVQVPGTLPPNQTHSPTPPPETALMASGMGGAAGAYQYSTDEGTRRSLYFWSRAFPIYLHYRWVRACLPRVEGGFWGVCAYVLRAQATSMSDRYWRSAPAPA